MAKTIALLICTLFVLGGCSAAVGINTDLIGPEVDHRAGYAQVDMTGRLFEKGRFSFENQERLFAIGSKDGLRLGAGIGSAGRMRIVGDLSIYCGGGLAIIPDGGDIDKLAHSWLYGTIDFGLSYPNKLWWLPDDAGLTHISSPFHHAADGDSGFNVILLKWRF